MHPLPRDVLASARSGAPDARAALLAWALPVVRETVRYRANADDHDDLVQDTMLAILMALPQCRSVETFTGWVRTVARTQAGMHYRRERLRQMAPLPPSLPGPAPEWDERLDLERALATVNEATRRAFRYRLAGYTLDEIAHMEGLSESGIKARVARGSAQVRERLAR